MLDEWRNNQLNKLSGLVAPRVTQFQGEERILVSDAIEAMLVPSKRQQDLLQLVKQQVVYLDGADSQIALEYLQDFYGNDPRVKIATTIRWDDWEELDEACHVLIHRVKTVASNHRFSIAPWDRDDLIQFLLAAHPAQCGSILGRIPSETYGIVRGGVSLWIGIVETMLAFPNENDLYRILVAMLRPKLTAVHTLLWSASMNWLGDLMLSAYSQSSKTHLRESIDKMVLLSDDPVYQSLLSIPSLQLGIATDRFAELLRKASLVGCDLRGARFHCVDFYLVDLRGAILDLLQRELLGSAGAILD